jgi:hypothetical protein
MTKEMITIHNVTTGEIETREMNEQELKQLAIDKQENESFKARQEAMKTAKEAAEAKLALLGLTTDDLKALGLGGN